MSSLSASKYRREASCSPIEGSNSWQSLLICKNVKKEKKEQVGSGKGIDLAKKSPLFYNV